MGIRGVSFGRCLLNPEFPLVTPFQRFFSRQCGFVMLPWELIAGGESGIYFGHCRLIPGFPVVTPSQRNREKNTKKRFPFEQSDFFMSP